MAQKRDKEETELKVPGALTLCKPSIAAAASEISGSDERRSSPDRSDLNTGTVVDSRSSYDTSPETPDLHQNHRSTPDRSVPNTGTVVDSRSSSGSSPGTPDLRQNCRSSPDRSDLNTGTVVGSRSSSGKSSESPKKSRSPTVEASEDDSNRNKRREVNRCSGCRRKVGLTGFRCRCGEMFCSDHRYSDRHDCCYDYKAAGREAIARENPVVRAAKILKV